MRNKMKKVILMALLLVPMSIFAQKFGHFDSSAIIQLMAEYSTAQTEIQQLQTQYEKDKANLLDNVRQRREAELQDLYTRIQQSYQDNQRSLQETSQQKMQAISEKMLGVIKQIGQDGGYVYIMDVSAGIPYISTTLSTDVTAEIKQKLGLK